MRKPGGYAVIDDWMTGRRECDTFTCSHCQQVVAVKPTMKVDEIGDICHGCMKMICRRCVVMRTCDPIDKKLERAEADGNFRRWFQEAL